jgi:hypothetical protein
VILAGAIVEQVAAEEVELGGDDSLVLVEEGGVMRAVDPEDLACGRPAGGLERGCREDGLVAGADGGQRRSCRRPAARRANLARQSPKPPTVPRRAPT